MSVRGHGGAAAERVTGLRFILLHLMPTLAVAPGTFSDARRQHVDTLTLTHVQPVSVSSRSSLFVQSCVRVDLGRESFSLTFTERVPT